MMFGLDAVEYESLANRSLSWQLNEESSHYYGHVVLRNAAMSIGDAHKVSLLARAGVVKCIDFHRCFVIGDGLASILSAALTNTSRVEWISAHHCNLNEVVLSRMKTYLPYFDQKGGDPEEGAKLLSNGVKRKSGGGKASSSKLASNPHLKVLDLSFSNLDSKAYRTVATIVSQSSNLEVLVLDGNRMHGNDVRSIIHSTRRHPCLKHLSLSGCKLSDECMEFVSFGVKSNANITHIDLSNNDITPLGFQILINAMEQGSCRGLKLLDLSYTSLGDEGVTALARCLARGKLPSLESLVLREVGAGQKVLLELMSALASNTSLVAASLHTLDISGNALEATASKAPKRSSYYDKLGKTLGIDPSKFTKKGASEYISSTAAAATPVINDGLAKLSSGISSLGSLLETGADAGLKMLTGEDDYSDAGVIRVDKDSGGYGYGVTYGKSRSSGRLNDSPSSKARRGSRRRKKKGRAMAGSRVAAAARSKAKARRKEEEEEEAWGEDGTAANTTSAAPAVEGSEDPQANTTKTGKGGKKSKGKGKGKSKGKSKGKRRMRSVDGVLALVQSLPRLRLLGLARCGLTDRWCSHVAQRSSSPTAHTGASPLSDPPSGVEDGEAPRVALLLSLNGLSEEAIESATRALSKGRWGGLSSPIIRDVHCDVI